MSLIQWNCNGFNDAKRSELKIISQKQKPLAYVIQETKLSLNARPSLRGYKAYFQNVPNEAIPKWGVLTLIDENHKSEEIILTTDFNAVAVKIYYPTEMIICNLYWPPKKKHSEMELKNLINQLGQNFLIMGDFNAHNPLWGSSCLGPRGKIIENCINEKELIILNNGSPTHLNFSHQSQTAIDITLCNAEIEYLFEWSIINDVITFQFFLKFQQEELTYFFQKSLKCETQIGICSEILLILNFSHHKTKYR
jgi:hypothetical protein